MRTSNQKSRICTSERIPFKANNLSGELLGGGMYIVWSYGWWPLYVYKNGKWYENISRYSVTTSKQKSQSRPTSDTIQLEHSEIKRLY